jgi:DNA-binding PadR family transcriptional regulator
MIEQELLLLGLLSESPKHGYEIKKKIRDVFSLFAGVDLKSIYYPLRVMEKRGLVEKKAQRYGRRPQRFVYLLTPKGRARFEELLTQSLLNFRRPQFTLDMSLYFLPYLDQQVARRRLRARTRVLSKVAADLRKMVQAQKEQGSAPTALILEHNLRMADAERGFLESLVKAL